ncbi:flavodoxin-dependent (E)-4-hydroxy-3-methylbut-2-enyl-diphosphate synthase [Heliorestis convoluta]|uniref:4-hydroxy-3-methylbut-2-en-1-yl diphosphate synthase (flavodoxin) n=1 Tax=Heliorestis convoluta TaxID=356322 RepID=A0A5Q2N7G3_9FIRM|nr:flavodoxin-dependent (E)-4-hydroxy-3-methylbut-2-enyl-diphosphate synthase [Heliorestis convoluta]QGG48210.1 1-hydroxy-2-methyl-2-(E)-butenyl 4-diphosphate synthase [Heliorestis convoluta]
MIVPLPRKKRRLIHVGSIPIGGNAPVSIQSMCNTDTRDREKTVKQIEKLAEAGCEIIRLAVLDQEAVEALEEIVKKSPMPVIADIHFDYKLAIGALKAGVHGLRLNPGNIGGAQKVREVIAAAREKKIPLRIGVNAGSLEKNILAKYQGITPEGMIESALGHIRILENENYPWMKISLKASSVPLMVAAYQGLAEKVDYPLHVGVTEAGTHRSGVIKSAVGIGALLAQGIGDTIRVSLTGDPLPEVHTAWEIVKSLGLRKRGPELISCPTCGRCQIDLAAVAEAVEQALTQEKRAITVAVMGCVVNGPGEAREADVGIAGGKDCALLFRQGKVIKKVSQEQMVQALLEEIKQLPVE